MAKIDEKKQKRMILIHFCMNHFFDWDLLRIFEAVARLQSLTKASKELGISQSSVSRKLFDIEAKAKAPLLLRKPNVTLTEKGKWLYQVATSMNDVALRAEAIFEDSPKLKGEVTLTTVSEMLRWKLVSELPSFCETYPDLCLHILCDNRISSLVRAEADVSLRASKPSQGDLVLRKIHVETYGLYLSTKIKLDLKTPWLGLAGTLAHIPEQLHAQKIFVSRPLRLLLEDVESLGLAVEQGLGIAILPRSIATKLNDVKEIKPNHKSLPEGGRPPPRTFWIVVHRAKRHVPKIRAVMDWLLHIPSFDLDEKKNSR